jgi:sugar (pentulose or hexulose) kinase
MTPNQAILTGKTALGIELGSTRIKAVLIGHDHQVLATGAFSWENQLENNLWTYALEDAVRGVQTAFAELAENVKTRYGVELTTVGAIGISGMMHGYLPLDKDGNQLAPFLTWRNTNTQQAADELTELFQFNIPLRWSIAHLYQAMLEKREHVGKIACITTLAGYIHYLLTGNVVIGIGEASGMFPIDSVAADYDSEMLTKFDALAKKMGYSWDICQVLPKVMVAGQDAGILTEAGAKLLDPTGKLQSGIPMVPPEGDAGTGMVATNSVAAGTGNVSAGTSIFTMVVLEKQLSKLYRDIDMVTTPSGLPVAMVHCNNGASELDGWMGMFSQLAKLLGAEPEDLYGKLFNESLKGDLDCGGLLVYNYVSAEPITGLNDDGRPLLVRPKESKLSLANFMRGQIYGIWASLAVGMQIFTEEKVNIRRLTGHGGLFKTAGVAQRYLAAAVNSAVTVMKTAGEGGPYGMALLAAYRSVRDQMSFEDFLENEVFAGAEGITLQPEEAEVAAFAEYLARYQKALALEHTAVDCV